MTPTPLTIQFHVSDKLKNNQNYNFILEDFEYYKVNSNDKEHPRPANHFQQKTESTSYYFGRDRFDTKNYQARKEEIQHVHYREENSAWEYSDGSTKPQWECTSNTYLVYSYFKHNGCNYYYLIDFIEKNAHNNENAIYKESISNYLTQAKTFRLSIVNTP
ncbi:hypothetical protein B9T26_10640 [Acinetobacter sp. ANC 4169]|uniref:type II toxin-antitoxin system YafO family toxin n=1 Tax=Acinetobacter sp. ANC 4169 TaxID=1977879 RepID=UPI000A335743|nr:type II toxin-antitoxin system YafO family toxin [Acinetobacter sp. ANC 4169]OTG72378.1 hypothetical protein B9T26_10640 [Acinetobacter sp. ANC 4169]